MSALITRRAALHSLMTTAAALPALPALAAAEKPHVQPNDPIGMALGYVPDATKVDPRKNPTWKAGSNCTNCAQLAAPKTGEWVGCNLFAGKTVAAKGWCRVWVKAAA